MPDPQRRVRWPEAAAEILRAATHGPVEPALSGDLPGVRVVGVSGRVGSGKSTLAARLAGTVLRTDDYLPNYDSVAPEERDDPARADLALLSEHLEMLRRGHAVRSPVWSFRTHRREGWREVAPSEGGLIVCEGIHALHGAVGAALDIAVLVEADALVRWRRWEAIERAGLRGMGVEAARRHFEQVAEPSFDRFEAAYRAAAHFIVENQ